MGADLAAEEQFGPYLVYERLGVGGMATVHRALERGIEGFERIVALKRLLPHLAEDASFIKAFVREAKLASILNHHNIVQIFELGRVGSQYFISMEYIEGRDVRRILRHARTVSGTPPINITVGLILQLAEALDYAHTKCDDDGNPINLVHRDVSPSNLLVTSQGHLKVIDFGIAKAQSAHLRTQTGRVKGKIAYMAPEATTSAKDLDARSDLWAAGVIAHELLTARPLFASKNEYQTLLKVQRGDIMPPSTFNQAVPPELDAIVLKALARDPDDRFADASQMREALGELRRKLKLQTGVRDIAQWLDWAFSLEPPSGAFGSSGTGPGTGPGPGSSGAFDLAAAARSLAGMSMSSAHLTPTPHPRREDDDAVEFAWGGGEAAEAKGPIELDDVPDVSDKHLVASRVVLPHPDDIDDDIPAPEPSHGIPRPKRDTAPQGSRTVTPLPLPLPIALPLPPPPDVDDERRATAPSLRPPTGPQPYDLVEEDRRTTAPRLEPPTGPQPYDPSATAPEPPPSEDDELIATAREPIRHSLDDMLADDALIQTQPRKRREATPRPVEDEPPEPRESRAWMWIVAVLLLGAAGAAVYLFVLRDDEIVVKDPVPARPARGSDAPQPQANLKLDSTPSNLEVELDGELLPERTPLARKLAPGNHTIVLRQNGTEVWRQTIVAEAEADLELSPVIKRVVGPRDETSTPDVGTGSGSAPLKPRVVGPAIRN